MYSRARPPLARTNWLLVGTAILSGIVVAIQLGKVAPLIVLLQFELELSLLTAGWLVSLFSLTGALFGILGGVIADRIGARKILIFGLAGIALASFLGFFAKNDTWLLSFRVIESITFLLCVVAAPRLIISATKSSHRSLAMGAWGSYMPIGMAIAFFSSPLIAENYGWQSVWLLASILPALSLIAVIWVTAPASLLKAPFNDEFLAWSILFKSVLRSGPMLMSCCFLLYAIQFFALAAWLPTYLTEIQQYPLKTAGLATALVVACNGGGNLIGALLLHYGFYRWFLIAVSFLIMGLCAVGIFSNYLAIDWKLPLAITFNFFGGFLPAAILAGTAFHAPQPVMIGSINGIVVQGANMGSLIGPPIMAALVEKFHGWGGAYWLMVFCSIMGIILAIWLAFIEKR